jgi:hypothetical protein
MRALFLIAALTATTPAIAASPTPPTPPVAPSPPALALENGQKAVPPLRLRSPLLLDDRRRLAPPGYKTPPGPRPGPEIG